MAVLLITFDIGRPVGRAEMARAIDHNWQWAKLTETSYAIHSESSPDDVYDKLTPMLGADDRLLVSTLARPWWGQFPADVLDWLKARL